MVEINFEIVPRKAETYLNSKQLVDYENKRREFVEWLLVFGKKPEKVEGYSEYTARATTYRIGVFERYVWEKEEEYVPVLTRDHADDYVMHLAKEDYSGSHRCNTRDALVRYFKWRHHQHGEEKWEPKISFSKDQNTQPRDFLTVQERRKVREAALDYGSIPSYRSLSPEERAEWKKYVSQRLRKPLEEVSPDDWERVNGWKLTSIVWTSLDAGLRPAEVGRAKVSWVDTENEVLRIPVEESTKNRDNWLVSISSQTAEALERWIEERDQRELYDDTDALWLTRFGNPYDSQSLKRLLHNLCEEAGIDTENRKMSWYSIRYSVGTYMTREEDLAAAQAQLRHRSVQTTMKYDAAPVEDRQDALDRMG
ncbi:tyrosine-type recombinase/integrase [Natronorubrum aibiense]|uniref:Tyrosine-type recombinase/integrase n=1 Tax=Natronorubrum aibiense TaxID=348826 RepID=A0A5P9P0X1_9EURY|nr:site-specific integrase [Natronorubrum aibiense]QFU81676.1 tyrosine-type recombinase/integrase [Natronorubrum aibiense]